MIHETHLQSIDRPETALGDSIHDLDTALEQSDGRRTATVLRLPELRRAAVSSVFEPPFAQR